MLVLPLQYPIVLLPGARVSLALPKSIGSQLAEALGEAKSRSSSSSANSDNSTLTIAAVPLTNPKSNDGTEAPILNEWACAARVTRLVRPSVLNQTDKHILTIQGRERVRLTRSPSLNLEKMEDRLPDHAVEYPGMGTMPTRELITEFKGAALKLLDRLVQDTGSMDNSSKASQNARREIWTRFANMVEEIADERVPWLADVMVWSIITDYNDRLGAFSCHLFQSLILFSVFSRHALCWLC